MSHERRTTLEKEIQRSIEAALGAERDFLLLRNSVGKARYVKEESGEEFFVPYGLGNGSPDIVGLLRVELRHRAAGDPVVIRTEENGTETVFSLTRPVTVGIWLCWEVKVPGEDATDEQAKVHEQWRRFGAIVDVVHSVVEARASLKRARKLS